MSSDSEQFVRFHGGVTHVSIPEYRFDESRNPFTETGADREKPYRIARYLDIALLHQFMYIGGILTCGVRSLDFDSLDRDDLIRQIQDSGGLPISDLELDYDFEALEFSPFATSFSTLPFFDLYHADPRYAEQRPHPTVDIWLVFDVNAYDRVGGGQTSGLSHYKIRSDYDRRSSLLALAVIN